MDSFSIASITIFYDEQVQHTIESVLLILSNRCFAEKWVCILLLVSLVLKPN